MVCICGNILIILFTFLDIQYLSFNDFISQMIDDKEHYIGNLHNCRVTTSFSRKALLLLIAFNLFIAMIISTFKNSFIITIRIRRKFLVCLLLAFLLNHLGTYLLPDCGSVYQYHKCISNYYPVSESSFYQASLKKKMDD